MSCRRLRRISHFGLFLLHLGEVVSLTAVSYTHLDVYKRQADERGMGIVSDPGDQVLHSTEPVTGAVDQRASDDI